MPEPQNTPTPIGKAVALIDGKEVEVAVVKPGEGLLAESDFQTRFDTRFQERATSLETTALEKALKDEGFRTRALSAWKIDPTVKPGKSDADVERRLTEARTQWENEALVPERTQREALSKELEEMRSSILDAEILEHARRVGVKDELTMSLGPNSAAMVVAAVRAKFGFDPKTKTHYAKDANGEFAFTNKPQGRKAPYQTVGDFFDGFASSKEYQALLDPQKTRQSVGGAGGSQGSGGRGTVTISRADARIKSKWDAAEAEAKKINGTVVISD